MDYSTRLIEASEMIQRLVPYPQSELSYLIETHPNCSISELSKERRDGKYFYKPYCINRVYKQFEREIRREEQTNSDNNSQGYLMSLRQRNVTRHILIDSLKSTAMEIKKKGRQLDKIAQVIDVEPVGQDLIITCQPLEGECLQFLQENPYAEVAAEMVMQIIEGLEEYEQNHLYDLDRRNANFMVKLLRKNRFICKHVNLNFCLKFTKDTKAQNLRILSNRYFQKRFAEKGIEFEWLLQKIRNNYDEMVVDYKVLKRLHDIQLGQFISSVVRAIEQRAQRKQQIREVCNIFKSFGRSQSRQRLTDQLKEYLNSIRHNEKSMYRHANQLIRDHENPQPFTKPQLNNIALDSSFIHEALPNPGDVQRYFINPIIASQQDRFEKFNEKEKSNLIDVLYSIEQHRHEQSQHHPIFGKISELLQKQMRQFNEESTSSSINFTQRQMRQVNEESNMPSINSAQRQMRLFNEESTIASINFTQRQLDSSIQSEAILNFLSPDNENKPSESLITTKDTFQKQKIENLAQSQSLPQQSNLLLSNQENIAERSNVESRSDNQQFKKFLGETQSLARINLKSRNDNQIEKLSNQLCINGFNEAELPNKIRQLGFKGIQKPSQNITAQLKKKNQLIRQSLKEKLDQFMKTEHATSLHKYESLHKFVRCVYNCKNRTYPEIEQLRVEEIYYLEDDEEEHLQFLDSIRKLYEEETCEVFRVFAKRHIQNYLLNATEDSRKSKQQKSAEVPKESAEKLKKESSQKEVKNGQIREKKLVKQKQKKKSQKKTKKKTDNIKSQTKVLPQNSFTVGNIQGKVSDAFKIFQNDQRVMGDNIQVIQQVQRQQDIEEVEDDPNDSSSESEEQHSHQPSYQQKQEKPFKKQKNERPTERQKQEKKPSQEDEHQESSSDDDDYLYR